MIELKSPEQVGKIRSASRVLVDVLNILKTHIKAGVKTKELDSIAFEEIELRKARPAFLGYRGFPGSICTCINEEIVHGIPGQRKLKESDILSIDIGVEFDGYFSDAAVTVAVGKVNRATHKLLDVTKEALCKAIDKTNTGYRISDISSAIQEHVEGNKLSVIRDFVGHGIGLKLHEDPQIPNFGQRGMGTRIKEGMVLAIEPMVSAGKWEVAVLNDGWTAITQDRSLTAHFEHTIAVTAEGPEVLTEGII
ncbi:MAG: type I methionyl aminopeptidase [Candidatus Omnitrophica bacterium]|nr:type I methionyl aminopeptidase [Candidatus Omnitrophota bacterium]